MSSTQTRRPQMNTAEDSSASTAETTATSRHNGRHRDDHSPRDSRRNLSKGLERQQDSIFEQSNMDESLDGGGTSLIDIDDEYLEADSGVPIAGEEQKDRNNSISGSLRSGKARVEKNYPSGHPRKSTRERLADITRDYKEQSAKLLEAEGTIREKDERITTLTETITRLHLRDGGMVRDDNYFTTQFSDITNSIEQWAVTYFPKIKSEEAITNIDKLPRDLAEIVQSTVHDSKDILSKRSRWDLINAMVINYISPFLFGHCILGAPAASETVLVLADQLQGTDYQTGRWRALTVNLLAQGPAFESRYNQEVYLATQSLGNLLTPLTPVESDESSRNTDLHKIVKSAAVLSLEIRKQTDFIYAVLIQPGTTFSAEMMEDLGCEYDELEELDGKAIVQVPIFPAIMRKSYLPSGKFDEPHNLMKAKVTTMFVDK